MNTNDISQDFREFSPFELAVLAVLCVLFLVFMTTFIMVTIMPKLNSSSGLLRAVLAAVSGSLGTLAWLLYYEVLSATVLLICEIACVVGYGTYVFWSKRRQKEMEKQAAKLIAAKRLACDDRLEKLWQQGMERNRAIMSQKQQTPTYDAKDEAISQKIEKAWEKEYAEMRKE